MKSNVKNSTVFGSTGSLTVPVYHGIWLSSILLGEITLASTVLNFLMNKFYQNEAASVLLK